MKSPLGPKHHAMKIIGDYKDIDTCIPDRALLVHADQNSVSRSDRLNPLFQFMVIQLVDWNSLQSLDRKERCNDRSKKSLALLFLSNF